MQYLKADTATTIRIGPFVDDADGKTAETALTIAQADVRLSKGGAAAAQKNDATSATHDENGYYRIPLNATDTNTEGTLDVCVSEAGALPVIAKFTVLPAEVYDSIVGGTDKLQIDLVQINGTSEGSTSIRANVVAAGGTQVASADDFKADLTTLNDPTAAAVATAVRSELATELGRIDADITSRAVAGDAMTLTTGERSSIGTAVWNKDISTYANAGEAGTLLKIAEANTDDLKTTTIIKADVVSISGDSTAANNLESYCDGTTPMPVNVTQISGDSTAANNLESYCDGTTPIPANTTAVAGSAVSGVADFRADVSGLPSASAISTQIQSDLATEIGRLDAAISSREASGAASTAVGTLNDPTAAAVATAVRNELSTELGRLDAAITTREASGASVSAASSVTVTDISSGALAKFATVDTGEVSAVSGSVAELSQGGGGGGGNVTVTDISQAALAKFATVDTGETTAVAGSVAKLSQGSGGTTGSGGTSVDITLEESDGTPITDAAIWISTDSAGSVVVAGTIYTDAFGTATFLLDAGTYYRWAQKAGYNFTNPQTFTVT